MTTLERLSEQEFPTVSELLVAVSRRRNEIIEEGRRKLYEEKNADAYMESLREGTRLLAGLPELLANYKEKGGGVPQEVKRWCGEIATMAREYLADDSQFGMASLLASRGSKIDEPDHLEHLALRLQSPNE
jgi:hypothetical protein